MNLNDAPLTVASWAGYALLTLIVMSIGFFISKRHVMKREGFRAAFKAWGGPGAWLGQTLLTCVLAAAGGLLIVNALDRYFP